MRIRSPSLVELHAFLAVARNGSFRAAAQALCVTQGAVSRAVLRLEETLGQAVFQRSPGGVELTPAGQELRQLVEKPVAELEAAAQRWGHQPERLRLRLRVSVMTSLSTLWLVPRLADFQQRHPGIEIEMWRDHPDEDFSRKEIDLWIVSRRSPSHRWPRQVSAQYLIGKEIVAVCDRKLARGVATPQQLLGRPLLYHSEHPGNWALWAKAVGAAMPPGWTGTGMDLVMNLVEAARAGMGVAIVQKCMVESDLRSGRLVMPVPGEASTGRGYYLCRRRAQAEHVAVQLFSQWVLEQARSPG
jgi:LysR family transcriptional regulator, glycine cleavage system transcriptional activator